MTFISYAQNFEDVMLWRALKGVGAGFYIDVGAAHPDIDSVTRAFYDRGWSGLNIEPVANSARLLRASRTRDTTLQVALGAAPGTTSFFVIGASNGSYPGLSTAIAPDDVDNPDLDIQETRVAVDTLAEVCRRHVSGPIHFLKVDVEGSERAVLEGADWSAFRPWIVLVEANEPMATTPNHAQWEPVLIGADYRHVWSDGLNRFYVAAERADQLAGAFDMPPNVFDDFIRPADVDVARLLSRREALLGAAENRARAAEERSRDQALRTAREAVSHAELERLYRERTADRHHLARHVHIVNAQALELIDRVEWLTGTVGELRTALGDVYRSTSWRITRPLRRVVARMRGIALPPEADGAGPAWVRPDVPPIPESVAGPLPSGRTYERPRRAVHQYHSDSSAGDAVTASMLLIRRLLRASGYRSHIYVANRDATLADELLLLEELPRTDDYVLIVHHSMGQQTLDLILSLPAPKVLVYHNVTPPWLIENPSLREAARVGREQLAQMRTHVAAALADSDFNATELRALGFDPVRTCTLLFDPADFTADAAEPRPEAPFTVLFVGRIVESKGQLELVETFARFVEAFGPARLVLVGRFGGTDNLYRLALEAAIRRHQLDDHVVITGSISDAERDGWYAAADLYVSLSSHEGFGVPLVEAMARGVPVLARPVGAVPDTLGRIGELLTDPSPTAVAERMVALARDPARRARMSAAGRDGLDRFAPSRHLPRLLEALIRAGADPAPEAPAIPVGLHFAVAGHVGGTYSLAAVNRRLLDMLDAAYPGRVRVLPVETVPLENLDHAPLTVRRYAIPAPETGPEVVISHHFPVYVPPNGGDLPLALFFWEESLVPADAVAQLNRFRGVLAPSRFVGKVLVDSGVTVPVHHLPIAQELRPFLDIEPRPADGRTVFLHVSSCFPRKGVDVLLAAYARAFRRDDPVELVIKGHSNPHNDVPAQIARIEQDDDAPLIRYIGEDLDDAGLLALFRSADAMVLPTRGEGLNLPAMEALAAGLPLIVTGWGGHRDFCGPDEARLLGWRFAPARSHVSTGAAVWTEPDVDDLVDALRERVRDPETARARAQRGRDRMTRLAGPEAVVAGLTDFSARLLAAPPPAPVRAVWISSFDVRCGVAEYSRHLLSALELDDVTVLSDTRAPEPGGATLPGVIVRPTWRLGDAIAVDQISSALASENPDIVMIQHQPGLIRWDTLAALLRRNAGARRIPTVTVLHSTSHLATIGDGERLAVLDALRQAARVLVHTVQDLNRLRRWDLVDNVALLPHGTHLPRPARPARALASADPVLLGCYGFLLPGKGIVELIEAVTLLRRRRPNLRLRLVNTLYPATPSHLELARCRAAIDEAGLAGAVELHTDFLPDERSLDLLAECDLIVIAHQHSTEAASGATHTALAAGVPVASTPLPLFDDLAGAVLPLPGFSPREIADGVDVLLSDPPARDRAAAAAAEWAGSRSWEGVAIRLGGMLRHLAAASAGPHPAQDAP